MFASVVKVCACADCVPPAPSASTTVNAIAMMDVRLTSFTFFSAVRAHDCPLLVESQPELCWSLSEPATFPPRASYGDS